MCIRDRLTHYQTSGGGPEAGYVVKPGMGTFYWRRSWGLEASYEPIDGQLAHHYDDEGTDFVRVVPHDYDFKEGEHAFVELLEDLDELPQDYHEPATPPPTEEEEEEGAPGTEEEQEEEEEHEPLNQVIGDPDAVDSWGITESPGGQPAIPQLSLIHI